MDCKSNLGNCQAACCKLLAFNIETHSEDRLDYYRKHGCQVLRLKRGLYRILVPSRCVQLDNDNLCKLHGTEDKPKLCRAFNENNKSRFFIPKGCLLEDK